MASNGRSAFVAVYSWQQGISGTGEVVLDLRPSTIPPPTSARVSLVFPAQGVSVPFFRRGEQYVLACGNR